MSSMFATVRCLVVLVALSALGAAGCGTDSEEACDIVCGKDAECQPGLVKAQCVSSCTEMAKDEAYADALIEQSACYEDVTCADLKNNKCVPQDI